MKLSINYVPIIKEKTLGDTKDGDVFVLPDTGYSDIWYMRISNPIFIDNLISVPAIRLSDGYYVILNGTKRSIKEPTIAHLTIK